MAVYRSRRLDHLLGSSPGDATYQQVKTLVDNRIPEAFDLDYKRDLYGNSDKDRRELAGDVAAMANAAGGLIILGIDEDEQGRAQAAPGVPTTDNEATRIQQVVASGLSPLPGLEVRLLPGPNNTPGFILVAVPPSPARPHAVLVNQTLRYPHRTGTTTAYLTEPEVATAYRDRLTGLRDRHERLEHCEQDLITGSTPPSTPTLSSPLCQTGPGS